MYKTIALSITLLSSLAHAQQPTKHLSTKLEITRAIERGNAYLLKNQNSQGFWSSDKYPGVTALALTALKRAPEIEGKTHITKGYQWLLSQQHADGGIYGKGLATYNTAISIPALLAANNPDYTPAILKARRFLINQQTDWDNKGETDNLFDGGIGYGGSYPHSDLSNTHFAIEAIALSAHLIHEAEKANEPDLNWEAAITFISRCQNLESNKDVPESGNDGSMNYFPGNSKAGYTVTPKGKKTLKGYGSMGYAGLLSMIYANLDAKDPRVIALKGWVSQHFTVKENPGLGQQGLYYYYQAMAKALSAANLNMLDTPEGKIDWREQLANALLSNQREDGSWVNSNSRWWESDPILVTTYAVLTLEQIYHSIPE